MRITDLRRAIGTFRLRGLSVFVLIALSVPALPGRVPGSRAEYLGGTRPDIPINRNGEIRVTDETYFIFVAHHTVVKVPYERINMLEYGQKVDRLYLLAAISPLFLSAKKREHFLTVGFENDNGKEEAMLFRLDKDSVRVTLVALEARTGRQIEFQDEDARIAGKG